jgi:NAD(P)-dependent dehydrogenase (short-subunit alcohol dehydrogenase family)
MRVLESKVAVVTGAASGIGRATATLLAREGMRVVVADIDAGGLGTVANELTAAGHDVVAVPTDVSSQKAIEARDAALDTYGAVHVVHNNAGVVASGLAEEISLDLWNWVLDVDLWSVIHGARTFAPLLKAQGEGHIVNTASTAGLQANPGIGPYNVAKFGVVALSETLRLEFAGTGVGVSVLCPGPVNTRIVDAERNLPAGIQASTGAVADRFRTGAGAVLAAGLDPAMSRRWCSMASATTGSGSSHPEWADRMAEQSPNARRPAGPRHQRVGVVQRVGWFPPGSAVGFGAMVLSPGLYGPVDHDQAVRSLLQRSAPVVVRRHVGRVRR